MLYLTPLNIKFPLYNCRFVCGLESKTISVMTLWWIPLSWKWCQMLRADTDCHAIYSISLVIVFDFVMLSFMCRISLSTCGVVQRSWCNRLRQVDCDSCNHPLNTTVRHKHRFLWRIIRILYKYSFVEFRNVLLLMPIFLAQPVAEW